jgi:hypothetical protein
MFDLPKPILTQLLTAYNTRRDTLTPSEQMLASRIRTCCICSYIWVSRKKHDPLRCPHCHKHGWDRPLVNAMLTAANHTITSEVIPQRQIASNATATKEPTL